jgi:serine/threonine protein kinase
MCIRLAYRDNVMLTSRMGEVTTERWDRSVWRFLSSIWRGRGDLYLCQDGRELDPDQELEVGLEYTVGSRLADHNVRTFQEDEVRDTRHLAVDTFQCELPMAFDLIRRCHELPLHPSVAPILGFIVGDDVRMVSQRNKADPTLKDLCRITGLTYTQRYKIIYGVACGLAHLHRHNLAFFNLCPSDISLDENLEPHIHLHGIAKLAVMLKHFEGILWSDIAFLAPEVRTGEKYYHEFDFESWRSIDSFSFAKIAVFVFFAVPEHSDLVLKFMANRCQQV